MLFSAVNDSSDYSDATTKVDFSVFYSIDNRFYESKSLYLNFIALGRFCNVSKAR